MIKQPLIIDTDLTRDDVVAIAMTANSSRFDIKAITCYGEWFVETVQLRDSLGLDCPVCWGAMKPLFRQQTDLDIYGSMDADFDGKTHINPKDEEYPWDKIYSEALKAEGELEILTLGPVTNIAQTILRYPQVKPLIKHIFCFAGSGTVGNAAPYSEYNAYADPDALKVVFESGIDVTMCGLDAVESCVLCREELEEVYPINETVKAVMDTYRRSRTEDTTIPAAAAASCFISRDITPVRRFYVTVETKGGLTLGETVVDRFDKCKKVPSTNVVTGSSKSVFMENLKSISG